MKNAIVKLFVGFLTSCFCLIGCGGASKLYVVTFDSNGGTPIESIKVKEGERIEKPKEQPTISHGIFDNWELFSGDVKIDSNRTIVNGQDEEWYNDYLGRDEGPYLAYSDLLFKAHYHMEKTQFSIAAGDISINDRHSFKNIIGTIIDIKEEYYEKEIELKESVGSDRVLILAASGEAPDLFFYRHANRSEGEDSQTIWDNMRDIDNIIALCEPMNSTNIAWVKGNFEENVYKDFLIEDKLYGIPFSWTDISTTFICCTNADISYDSKKFPERLEIIQDMAKTIGEYYLNQK